jgi:hypothetical protein
MTIQRDGFNAEYKTREAILHASENTASKEEYLELKQLVKALHLKRAVSNTNVEFLKSKRWWITHHIRSNCRRLGVMQGM